MKTRPHDVPTIISLNECNNLLPLTTPRSKNSRVGNNVCERTTMNKK